MLNFDFTLKQFKNKIGQEVDKETLDDLYTLARDNMITLANVKKFVDGLVLVSHDEMLHHFGYRDLEDILEYEPVRQIGDRWII